MWYIFGDKQYVVNWVVVGFVGLGWAGFVGWIWVGQLVFGSVSFCVSAVFGQLMIWVFGLVS